MPTTEQTVLTTEQEDIVNSLDELKKVETENPLDQSEIDDNQADIIENSESDELFRESVDDEELIPEKVLPRLTSDWFVVSEAVVGLMHRRATPPLPCQDAFCISNSPRVTLLVSDGAGSAAVSEIGANAVVNSCQRLLFTLDDQIAELLDRSDEPEIVFSRRFALRLVKHAMGTLEDISRQQRREIKDYRCTFLALIVGKEYLLWIKVGDGALVVEQGNELFTLGELGKGEFANQTTFIDDKLTPDSVQFGTVSSAYISGLAAMSDGSAERLVSNDGSRVAGRMAEFFIQLRKDSLSRTSLTDFLHDKDSWRGTSGDDKCLALAAR